VKRIALIACSNGYGHIRRLLLLADALRKSGANPVLFAPIQVVKILSKTENVIYPEVFNFNTRTSIKNWLEGSAVDWINVIPDLSEFDIVVSDNLIEVLLIRPDAWISGSFFWHESLKGFPEGMKLQSLELLDKYKPKMISSKMFSFESLKTYANIFEVGLYTLKRHVDKNKKDALIACGKGGFVIKEAKEFVKLLAKKDKTKFKKIWVEPEILPNKYPSWMVPATFTHDMYQGILAAVIRPGIGTVTSSLLSGARLFSFYEQDSLEMKFNASRIKSYDIGENFCSIGDAWDKAELFLDDDKSQENHFKKIKKINMNGAQEAADIILRSK